MSTDAAFAEARGTGSLAIAGSLAGAIKLAGAGLSYLLLVVVAMVTDERQFGYFGVAFSLAGLAAAFGTLGQHAVILRFWPEWTGKRHPALARALLVRSWGATVLGANAMAILLVVSGYLAASLWRAPIWIGLCMSAAVLAAGLGVAEVLSSSARARGLLLKALLPRDVIWRGLAIMAFGVLALSGDQVTAVAAMVLVAGALWLSLAAQIVGEVVHVLTGERIALDAEHRARHRQVSLGVWAISTLTPASGQLTALVVAATLGPEWAGAVFAADRTARLASIALNGVNQILAPQISRAYHTGDSLRVQQLTATTGACSLLAGTICFLVFLGFGRAVMQAFDPAYGTTLVYSMLLVMAAGQVVNAATGPTGWLLQMSGEEGSLLRLLVLSNVLGFAVMLGLIHFIGPMGAAIGIALTAVLTNLLAVRTARRRLGIDPSAFGYFRLARRR